MSSLENTNGKGKKKASWFWKWFLNNQVVTALLIILLCLLIILVFTKVSHIFTPIWQFLGIVGLPVVLAGILYYMLNPIVDWLESKHVKRIWSILLLFVLVIALIVWGVVILVPKIEEQTMSFIKNWPSYFKIIESKSNEILSSDLFKQFGDQIESATNNIVNSFGSMLEKVSKNAFQGIGNVVGVVINVVLALVTMPFILFYLLKDGKRLPEFALKFLPNKMRQPTFEILSDINQQVSQYIRGQLTVAFAVAVMFIIGLSIIGLDYSVTLGILAGFLNLIPFLGSALAMVPILVLAIVSGPAMIISCLIVFVIEQTIEGRVISPLVLGSQMDIHPVTVIFVLLTTGKLFGITGVILGLPGYAAIKVIVKHAFNWYEHHSGLYEDETNTVEEEENHEKEIKQS